MLPQQQGKATRSTFNYRTNLRNLNVEKILDSVQAAD